MLKYELLIVKQYLKTLVQMHSAIRLYLRDGQRERLVVELTNCQEYMIQIDEIVEHSEGENLSFIHDMELYCENVYLLSQNDNDNDQGNQYWKQMTESFAAVLDGIETVQVKKEIVFFPYKASMWDSLESIWMAAEHDPECMVSVVPIPYYERNESGQFVAEKYEINQFPPYVPVIDYRKYIVSQRLPDVAYIHNPFDQFNNVTSVHPDYYSVELKKFVEKLVYVPYFVTLNGVFYTHRELPSYYRADYILVQSEKMMESFSPSIPKEKFIPLGHPIVDRILRLDKNKPEIPEQWKSMLPNGKDFGGKITVMLNTSLSMMMKERDSFLDKIENVIDVFSKDDTIFVIWRPHPLMHSTLQRMGDSYYNRFLEIEKYFLKNKIGVLDTTADVGITVALCDAYVGESASSLVDMFGIAGKPRFLYGLKVYQAKDVCNVKSFGNFRKDDEEYFVAEEYRLLCRKNLHTEEIEQICKIPGTKLYPYEAYRDIYVENETVYIQPYSGEGLCIYNMQHKTFRKIYIKDSIPYAFESMLYKDGGLYLMPNKYDKIVRFDIRTEEFSYYEKEDETIKEKLADVRDNMSRDLVNYSLSIEIVGKVRALEIKERTRGTSTVYEDDENTLQDFLFYITVDGMHSKLDAQFSYKSMIENFDGTCGQKVHEYMKYNV